MALNYVIMSIKLCQDVGNDKGISLYNFGGLISSGFEVIEGEAGKGPRWREGKPWEKELSNRFIVSYIELVLKWF